MAAAVLLALLDRPAAPPPVLAVAEREAHAARAPRVVTRSEAPPTIASVTVEKSEVCAGEENLVTVVTGDDPWQRVMVGATGGLAVPLRVFSEEGEWPEVVVHGKDGALARAPVPRFRLKDCRESRLVALRSRLNPNTWAEYDLAVRVVEDVPGPAPVAYRWQFGDGSAETTQVPRVTHSYADRAQDTLVSTFLVAVEVVWPDGTSARGRASLQLDNPAFAALAQKQLVQLFRELEPRFPVRGPDGVVWQAVHLRHARPVPVTLTRVTRRVQRLDGTQGAPEPVDVRRLFGTTTLDPGQSVEARVSLDPTSDPQAYSIDYLIEGQDSEGHAALGSFSVMRPPDPPTRGQHQPVDDPVMQAKIATAMRVLGQDAVSLEEILRLEREGLLK